MKSQTWISGIFCAAAFGGTLTAQSIVVVGTGDPNVDIPAVQAAVNEGGSVTLKGHFSFNRPPTAPNGSIYNRMVTISNNVVISGGRGDMPVIEGGDWPFLVDAGSAHVTIQGLHFVSPSSGAIWVYSTGGIVVTDCKIESVQPIAEFATEAGQGPPLSGGIFIGADPHPPSATHPGIPENFSGTLASSTMTSTWADLLPRSP